MYKAHYSEDKTRSQSVAEHLQGTQKLAGEFAAAFDCREWGDGCGLLHDIGKYSASFKRRIDEGGPITDHATAGAKELYNRGNVFGAYCISGHHSGLLDGGTLGDSAGEATLMGRMKKRLDDYSAFQHEVEIPAFPAPLLKPLGKGGFSAAFFVRMLFSSLVDADYLDTEEFMKEGKTGRESAEPMDILLQRLKQYVAAWLENTDLTTINGRRSRILQACFDKGQAAQGLYQLTVPTGGGKTISSLAFALQHAIRHHLQHIIYVIPYTNIIEQTSQIFRHILGDINVLEDHCNVSYDSPEELKRKQLAAENWDCPVVVTTNVQFFESLFSNRTSKCRKLHNIAKSVIIFDEAQMLPSSYLKPCTRVITELVTNYHCTAVLCTATQPSLEAFFPQQLRPVEICPDIQGQYVFFKRTAFQMIGELTEEALVERLNTHGQILCILNSRKRVQSVYKALKGDGTYHLSTFMYPIHRKNLLKKIKTCLENGQNCRVIATSLVEAGVDLDFKMVYRELAGIDSVIQAGGRCNREGKEKPEESRTVVFTLEESEDIHIPGQLKLPITVAGQIARKYEDISSLEAIHEYFERLYHFRGNGLDAKNIVDQFEQASRSLLFPFATVAEQFHLIENETKAILIDRDIRAQEIVESLRNGAHSLQLLREAGQYCVNVYQNDFESLNGAGLLEALDEQIYVLRDRKLYSDEMGLLVNVSRGEAVFA